LFRTFSLKLSKQQDTIYALSTGWGKSAIAVLRVSGPAAKDALSLCGSQKLKPRFAHYRTFVSKENHPIDQGLVLWFPGPKSFTGEDMLEFQIHGSPGTKQAMLNALANIDSFRQAEPVSRFAIVVIGSCLQGEFSKRALMNGKMDLIQVEGLADVIHAESEDQVKLGMMQL
jgi:tRNA modification GTPase